MTNFFPENSCAKCGGETIPRFLFKNSKSLDQQSEVLYILFLLYVPVEDCQSIC